MTTGCPVAPYVSADTRSQEPSKTRRTDSSEFGPDSTGPSGMGRPRSGDPAQPDATTSATATATSPDLDDIGVLREGRTLLRPRRGLALHILFYERAPC